MCRVRLKCSIASSYRAFQRIIVGAGSLIGSCFETWGAVMEVAPIWKATD
jgi:hypothetical protein